MKNLTKTLAAIALVGASFTTLAATQVESAPANAQSIGVISAQAGTDLSGLKSELANEAQARGASAYRIIFTSGDGDNHTYGTAELYK
ncbi:multiple stress resistance protein BhsA [Ewingella americana]|uniref:multiple stress resistance protein BhsA n=1 Tax=Ewingella americana TaxID=41202 RepID=UPI0012AE904A|nr:DUF1471 domain-containing protein [Ewingella americana]MRT05358.1 DUF1471 domain-containing protein [Ewingella americana]